MKKARSISITLLLLFGLISCAKPPQIPEQSRLDVTLADITSEGLMKTIKVLASNEAEGRAPGTKGEDFTVDYLIQRFKQLGLKPGNPDGTFLQKVPLMGILTEASGVFKAPSRTIALQQGTDWVAVCRRFIPRTEVKQSKVVFVGYGVVAPEYGWDDYKGVDVRGKTIIMLINDPPIPDPRDPSRLDEKMFQGKAMTYYGRWTYKYEIAAKKGAAAVLIVHETAAAGYPFEVVSGSWGRENFEIRARDQNMRRAVVESWISLSTARALFAASGQDYEKLKKAAIRRDFKPVTLNCRASFQVKNSLRKVESNNVVAKWEGVDPNRRNEYVIYTAHWDHLGKDPLLKGDQIYHGARDNASGVAALLEIARTFTKLDQPPKRSLLFLALTGEEKGLLGARYFAENPLYPLKQLVADLNMDGLNTWGRTSDAVVVGSGMTTLEDLLSKDAREQGRMVKPDPEPEKGGYFRSDHFEFAKVGVPALNLGSGSDYIGLPPSYGIEKRQEYLQNDYHKVTDDVKSDWDLRGMVEDAQLLFLVGYRITQDGSWPQWKEGVIFKKIRDAQSAK
jgi:Zn-dependent M28 family amino/carboxypeptidase